MLTFLDGGRWLGTLALSGGLRGRAGRVRAIDVRFVVTGLGDAGLQIVADYHRWHVTKEPKGACMRTDPVIRVRVPRAMTAISMSAPATLVVRISAARRTRCR
jgi:hypothetical protein